MKYLEALALTESAQNYPAYPLRVATSGEIAPLIPFFSAAFANCGYRLETDTLPFNTLRINLLNQTDSAAERELFLLFPWDFAPALNWRTGRSGDAADYEAVCSDIAAMESALSKRRNASIVYVPAETPPTLPSSLDDFRVRVEIEIAAKRLGAAFLSPDDFSLSAFLRSGVPVSGSRSFEVATACCEQVLKVPQERAKVLCTDLDNTLWGGVIGEDGLEGITYSDSGSGYKHYIYQTLLGRLRRTGTLLAAVSRNDMDLALSPFRELDMHLPETDFVSVSASYGAKSDAIRKLAEELNLGLDAFVFVDDNPIELEEVRSVLPEVRLHQFPQSDGDFPGFLSRLAAEFDRNLEETPTEDDFRRTELYRARLAEKQERETSPAGLTDYLRGLNMELTIHDRSVEQQDRAIQLINKTNQFNANGIRREAEDIRSLLKTGGRLYTVNLEDRHGPHGEILSCLIDRSGVVRSFVLSCRVFQRRIEYAFLNWLTGKHPDVSFEICETKRNEPAMNFFTTPPFWSEGGLHRIDAANRVWRQNCDWITVHDQTDLS